jgi:hypothetical protein
VAYTFTFLVERRRICLNLYGNGVLYVTFNSNTPLPKRYGTKCPATISGVPCAGAACRSRRKGCLYWLFRRDPVAGRHAIVQLKSEGYEVV